MDTLGNRSRIEGNMYNIIHIDDIYACIWHKYQ